MANWVTAAVLLLFSWHQVPAKQAPKAPPCPCECVNCDCVDCKCPVAKPVATPQATQRPVLLRQQPTFFYYSRCYNGNCR